ncbi:MAG: wax ester/triacylglycerol synthase family O-acyltransferase [Sporichthyaceae bacterium]
MQDWALSPLDISFLSIETAKTPMTMGALMVLEPQADREREDVVELLRARAAELPRLRRRLSANLVPFGGASWVPDPDFDVKRHVIAHRSHGSGARGELNAWVARLLTEPLDRAKPLWEFHVLSGLADDLTAILVKVHHSFLDGLGTVALAFALADGGAAIRLPGPDGMRGQKFGTARSLARRIHGPLSWNDPRAMVKSLAHGAGTAAGIASGVVRNGHQGLPFDREVSGLREFASASVPLADLRLLRRQLASLRASNNTPHGGNGGTANDVLVALMAGAMRHWLLDNGLDADRVVRSMVPVATDKPQFSGGAGNNFSAFLLDLPLGEPDPVRRVAAVCDAMTRNRALGPEGGPGAVQHLTNLMHPAVVRVGGPILASQAHRLFDVLISTIPIPRPVYLGGLKMTEAYPVAPLAQGQPLQIALSTYGGRGFVGISADPVAVPDPAGLAAAGPAELERLKAAAAGSDAALV